MYFMRIIGVSLIGSRGVGASPSRTGDSGTANLSFIHGISPDYGTATSTSSAKSGDGTIHRSRIAEIFQPLKDARDYALTNPMILGVCPHLLPNEKEARIAAKLAGGHPEATVESLIAMRDSGLRQSDLKPDNLAGIVSKIGRSRTKRMLHNAFKCAVNACLHGSMFPPSLTARSTAHILNVVSKSLNMCGAKFGYHYELYKPFLVAPEMYQEYKSLPRAGPAGIVSAGK